MYIIKVSFYFIAFFEVIFFIFRYDHISREYHNARETAINEFNQIKNDQLRRLQNISSNVTNLKQLSRDYLQV